MRYLVVKVGSGLLEEVFAADAGVPRTVYLVVDTEAPSSSPMAVARCDDGAAAISIVNALNA